MAAGWWGSHKSLPAGAHVASALTDLPADKITFIADVTAADAYGRPVVSQAIFDQLLPRYIEVQIYRALLENVASEMGAKMSAMDSATRNAGEMIKKQTTLYNRTRQAMITKELIEIISGAEAL